MSTDSEKLILEKLNQLLQFQNKNWLLQLTEDSSVLLDTQDIADLMGFGYRHTYQNIVSQPDFPRPVKLVHTTKKRGRPVSRRWIAGDVVRYIRQRSAV